MALSEAERVLPGIIDQLENELKRLGLQDEKLSVRMTGCPNGCARPYQSDIGLVGRSGDKYTIFVGGQVLGNRLNFQLKDLVPLAEIVPTLRPLLEHFKTDRQTGESFGDYCHRLGVERLQGLLPAESAARSASKVGENQDVKALLAQRAKVETNGFVPHGADATRLAGPEATQFAANAAQVEGLSSETVLAGAAGEERPDYTLRFNSDGSVRETIIYFYGDDRRAAGAQSGDPLRREAVYLGRVDPSRLHAARKTSDTHLVGPAGHERRDYRLDYLPDGRTSHTLIFYYEGNVRASEAPSGAAVRRQVEHEGNAG